MSLQSNGAITMAEIEAEYDDYSSSGFSLSGYYGKSRGLPTGGAISFSDFYSQNAYAGISVGAFDTGFGWWYGYDRITTTMGSLTGGTFDYWFPGNTSPATMYMLSCYWTQANTLYFHVSDNTSYYYLNTSSAFYRLFINGYSFIRTSATYSDQGSYRRWVWSTATNPFGTSGTKQMALRMS